ncbi:MAG: phage tail protein [Proteobacteria bacterium]|nr:phage tail protein [Pseudomonadota bacterium]
MTAPTAPTAQTLPAIQPSRSTRKTSRTHTQTIRFGGGHSVVVRGGLIPPDTHWLVAWQGLTLAQANALESFLAARHGSTAFLWQPPGASTSQHFICPEWKLIPSGGEYYGVEAQFRRIHHQTARGQAGAGE